MKLRLHAISHNSRANGPGRRTVIHTQGCSLGCPGCFNPLTHTFEGGMERDLESLLDEIRQAGSEGVTLSGGEPTEQLEAVLELCRRLRAEDRSILMFSGRTIEEIRALLDGPALLATLDVLIDGRFDPTRPTSEGLRGSSNQRVHLLTSRHAPAELDLHQIEVTIEPTGQVRITGFPDPALAQRLRRRLEG